MPMSSPQITRIFGLRGVASARALTSFSLRLVDLFLAMAPPPPQWSNVRA
jgi:hypothetical protein